MRPIYKIFILIIATLAVYYLSLFAGISQTDDQKMVLIFQNYENFDLIDLFIRKKSYYWRPLNSMSYLWDGLLWNFNPMFMHLENILFHIINGLLVFSIINRLITVAGREAKLWPLAGALLFALHPIATESVCWVSGRTDLLAGVFVLGSLRYVIEPKVGLLSKKDIIAVILFFCACLCKETALFFFGGAVWMIWVQQREQSTLVRHRVVACLPRWLLWGVTAGIYLLLRSYALGGGDSGIRTVKKLAGAGDGLFDMLRVSVKVFGFYFKKFFVPFPLNFGIIEVSDYYILPGLLLVALLCVWVWRQDRVSAFFIIGFCLVLPTLLVVFGKLAWTPVAERYLYIASAPGCIGLILLIERRGFSERALRRFAVGFVVILLCFAVSTAYRSWQWYDGKALMVDTIKHSPGFLPMYTDVAAVEIRNGNLVEAEQWLQKAEVLDKDGKFVAIDMLKSVLRSKQERLDEAKIILQQRLENPHKKFMALSEMLIRLNLERLSRGLSPEEELKTKNENLDLLLGKGQRSRSPFLRYRIGKAYLSLGNKDKAWGCFEEAYLRAPQDSHYKEAARVLAGKIEGTGDVKPCVPTEK